MRGKTHVFAGTAVVAAMTIKYPESMVLTGITVNTIAMLLTVPAGSYGPDVDIRNSTAGNKYKLLSKMLTHRGITHTFLVPAILYCITVMFKDLPLIPSLIMGFNVGWVIHIVADLFNKKGVPVFWPLTNKKFHIATVKTGTAEEYLFLVVWLGGLFAWLRFF